MNTQKGFVGVHRSLQEHWLWDEKPFSKGQAWIDLIMLANYKEEKFAFKDEVIHGKRGTVYRSITYLAERWGWGRDKVSRFLRQLESDGMVRVSATTHQTTIFIVNYGLYQGFSGSVSATNRQPVGNQSAANQQPVGTYNKENNSNQGNKGNKAAGQSEQEIEAAEAWFESLEE